MSVLVVGLGHEGLVDAGLALLRVTVGLLVIGHAVQKSLGWLGGDGLTATAAIFDRVGYRPGRPMVVLASITEILGAVLLIAGALTPFAGALVVAVMLVACSVHWQFGIWAAQRGFELPLTFAAMAAGIALIGPGGWSLDAVLGLELPVWAIALAFLVTLLGAAAMILRRALILRSVATQPR